MKKYHTTILFLLLAISMVSAQVPEEYYFIVPGTMSYRLDGSENPALSDQLVRGTYYGADVGGAMTGFNTSQYKDFALFHHPTDPDYITDPDDVNNVPDNKFQINFRIAYPSSEYYDLDTASRETLYPMIVFMHGAGERADCWRDECYGVDDPRMWNNDHNLVHGGNQHLNAINAPPSDPRHWPGFVVFPQSKNGWNKGSGGYTSRVIAMIETLMEKYPIDPNRIYIHGLSNGAQGTWMLLHSRPDLFAAAAPMSGYRTYGIFNGTEAVSMDTTMIHIPIWQFQGGEDDHPYAENTERYMDELIALGGTPRYTLYPGLGHGVWNTAYKEPDFFSWFLQYSKLTIHAYYGISEICDIANMSVRLGVSKGFDAYEWRMIKNDEYIPMESTPERPNEIIATEVASYQVRIARGSTWSEWSEPYTFTTKAPSKPHITANGSTALPALDGKDSVTLQTTATGVYYEWYKNDAPLLDGADLNSITVAEPGAYTLVVKDEDHCNSDHSNTIHVSTPPYGTVPTPPQNLTAKVNSENVVNLFWEDQSDNELGFEVYRSTNGTDYTWVTTTAKDLIMYSDSLLMASTKYFYKVRAYNRYGASAVSKVITIETNADHIKPSAPPNFKFEHFAYTEHRGPEDANYQADEYFTVHSDQVVLSWSPARDNIAVSEYKVYFSDGTLAGTTSDTSIIIDGLNKERTYSFYAVAVDGGGNSSTHSNQVTVTTVFEGLYFNLYAGGTWDVVRNFSNWSIYAKGRYPNFSLAAKNGLYDEGTDYFAFDFFGYIYIETAGEYTFYTRSNDGSQLWIGSTKVVDNDATRETSAEVSGTLHLDAGVYPITVKYFERSGAEDLVVYWSGPGINKEPIPDWALKNGDAPANIQPPSVPADVVANAASTAFRIDLSWNAQAASTQFEIYRSTDGEVYEIVYTTAAGETSYKDEGLESNKTYHYKLKAINESGVSEFSAKVSATTITDTSPPTIPENLMVQSKTHTQIALSWDNAEDNIGVKEYIVTYVPIEDEEGDEQGARSGISTGRMQASTKITPLSGITIDELQPQTTYSFTVAARDASGNTSGESEALTVETLSEDALPVEFIDFSYSLADDQVILKWTTGSEHNNAYFSIERSLDSGNFVSIGQVDGSGTTHELVAYEFTDSSPLSMAYYRIKQVDLDGNHSYSKVIRVALDLFEELTIYPNPTSPENINIRGHVVTEKARVNISLFDALGKNYLTVETDPNSLAEGVNIGINNALHPGVYIVVISDGTNRSQKRVIIE